MSSPAEELLKRHRLTVEDYYRMGEAGIFAPDARVELIEGEIIDMTPIGRTHSGTVTYLTNLLATAAAGRALVTAQNPLRLSQFSEPQPDLMLVKPRADFYRDAHPVPADVLLLIEVADSSLRYDCQIKLPLYARHGIAETWLVDLEHRELTRHLQPGNDGYQTQEVVTDLAGITPKLLAVTLNLSALFG